MVNSISDCSHVELVGWITLAIITASLVYNVLHFVYTTFLGSFLGRNINLKKCGPWAVVTGATDGIGKSFVKKMAEAKLNVVLISRTPSKLEETAKELKEKYGSIQVKTIAVDFSESQSIYSKLKAELGALEIGILVNNVGMTSLKRFDAMPEDKVQDIINLNVMSTTRMCHIVLPQMIQRKKGVIINIGSVSSAMPSPLYSAYGGTKAFVDKFTLDLAAEVRSSGVIVQVIHPGFVHTKLAPLKRSKLLVPDSDSFVKGALRTLGLEDRSAGYWWHKILIFAFGFANFFVPRRIIEDWIVGRATSIREKTIKQLKSENNLNTKSK